MDESISKLQGDFLREELKSLDTLETWGASLFLGAIALVSKQIIDWGQATDAKMPVLLHTPIYLLPAVVGLFAFLFLRIVNFRIRLVRDRLYALTDLANKVQRPRYSFGCVGWLMALMPLLLGYAASWYFTLEKSKVNAPFWWLFGIGVAVVIAALIVFLCFSARRSATGK
jgi:hypothetical protein